MDYSGLYYNYFIKGHFIFTLENECYTVINLKDGRNWTRNDLFEFTNAVSRELGNGTLISINSPAIKIMFGINDES